MDWFRVTLHLAGATGERFQLMEALVDTGASYTWIPRDVLEGLGVRPDEERVFVLADGRAVRSHYLRAPSLSVPLQIPDLIKIHIPAAEHSHNL